MLPATIEWAGQQQPLTVLIDSGADENFIDTRLAFQLGLQILPLDSPLVANALNGRKLADITHVSAPVSLLVSGNHREQIQLHIIESPHAPLVLGHPWLRKHNPHIDWVSNKVLGWSPSCLSLCLCQAHVPVPAVVDSPGEFPDLSAIPSVYMDLKAVFSKSRAVALPPHRPYDCGINLLPGKAPPRGRLYSLSRPEYGSMEKYIQESLTNGIIRPSSSPAGAGFLLLGFQ